MLLTVVQRYLELAMAESSLDAIHQGEDNMRVVVLATAAFAKAVRGGKDDFNRARTDALLLHAEEQALQEEVAVASAELSRVLHLDPSIRLRTQPGALEIVQLVDPDYSLEDLVQMAQAARPELAARAADIAAADYRVRQEDDAAPLSGRVGGVQRRRVRRGEQPPGPGRAGLLADLRGPNRFRRHRRLVAAEPGVRKHGPSETEPRRP